MTESATKPFDGVTMLEVSPKRVAVLEARIADLEARIAGLAASVEARDEFIAVAAHELRNPLMPIALQVEMLLAQARRTATKDVLTIGLERLNLAVDRFLKRAALLLDVARVSSGNFQLELTEVDLSTLVQQVITTLTAAAEIAACPLHAMVQAGVTGYWDRLALEQILENLISNAIKYGDATPITISLAADSAFARLSVRDEGRGISTLDQERIFGRFERAVAGRTHSGGFGVGLWLSQQLATAMHGGITVSSEPGKSSTFTVVLPRDRATDGC